MKVLIVSTLFAVLSGASAGSVAWPGAREVTSPAQSTVLTHSPLFAQPTVFKTVVPPQTKISGFSTTQYINSVPSAVPIQHQVHYQVPQVTHYAPVQHTAFYPVSGGSYYPGNFFYPPLNFEPSPGISGAPIIPQIPEQPTHELPSFQPQQPGFPSPGFPSPGFPSPGFPSPGFPSPGFPSPGFPSPGFPSPGFPSQSPPSDPSQSNGDDDTAVVDSADFPQEQSQGQLPTQPQDQPQEQGPSTEAPQQDQPSTSQPPSGENFPVPSFPPQGGAPTFPSLPQLPPESISLFPGSGNVPSFPQFPQGDGQPSFPSLPQFPQDSLPQLPQLPQFPSNPNFPQVPTQAPPSSFPGDAGGDKGLNDEDTISVESA